MLFRVGFVALFVVACGFLLMLGGAISLLLGFDIVLTERGAAMTIGGVVALSSGVIAVGIGFALKRLNQILRALEARAGKPVRSQAPDRPVLPIASDDKVQPSSVRPTVEAAPSDPSRLDLAPLPEPMAPTVQPPMPPLFPPIAPPPVPSSAPPIILGTAAGGAGASVAAGAAAGAGLALGSTLFGRSNRLGDNAQPAAEGTAADVVTGSEIVADRASDEGAPAAVSSMSAPPPVPQDLEDELSRALAETSVPRDLPGVPPSDLSLDSEIELSPESPQVPIAAEGADRPANVAQDEDRSFEDGLSQLLGRRSRAPAMPVRMASDDDQKVEANRFEIEPQDKTSLTGTMLEHEPSLTADTLPPLDVAPEPAAPEELRTYAPEAAVGASDLEDVPPDGEQASVDNSWQEIIVRDIHDPEVAAVPVPEAVDPAEAEADIFADPAPAQDEKLLPPSSDAEAEPNSQPSLPNDVGAARSAALGTYTIDGRTYSMFADGSVEAVNERGEVERFASMNELRRHLAGA